jgi:hypothetical protein
LLMLGVWRWTRPSSADVSLLVQLPPSNDANSLRQVDQKYCQWTVVAGDSNNRMAFEEWEILERKFRDGRSVHEANRSASQYAIASSGHKCQQRWADKEMLIVHPPTSTTTEKSSLNLPRCHIVSSKFMIDQHNSVQRLRTNMTNSSYCGSELASLPLPEGYKRPPQPDMIWYSAGFWALHKEQRASCRERFGHVVEALMEWKRNEKGIKRVVWQTAFEVNYHFEFNNSIIKWDYQCQKKLASQYGIELADIYTIVHAVGSKNAVYPGDCHLMRHKLLIPHQYLDRCCGGWESYLGVAV